MRKLAPLNFVLPTLALATLIGMNIFVGCSLSQSKPEHITMLITGDSRGYLEPCGCRRDQAGGLPVRATLIRRQSSSDPVLFDVGNITSGERGYELLKLHYLLLGMHDLGYDGVNIGQTDAQMDLSDLTSEVETERLSFVSANVFNARSGVPVTALSRIVYRGGLRIGVTGVVGNVDLSGVAYGSGVDVKPPVEALAPVISQLRSRCDILVVLCWSDQETIDQIATRYPEIDAIFGGNVAQSSGTAQIINRAVSFNVVDQGKVIGQVDLQRSGPRYTLAGSAGIKVSTDGIPGSTDMLDLIGHYKDELRERHYQLTSDEGMESIVSQSSTADQYVGEEACISCHPRAYDVSIHSKHMAAFATLVAKNSDYDPECLSCHTVGYGQFSGFVDEQTTPKLENVQCENCHGPGKQHVIDMEHSTARHNTGGLLAVTPATCIKCHDRENSENFNYATFWPKISH